MFGLMLLATQLVNAEERTSSLPGHLGGTTISGYVDSSIAWLGQSDPGPASGGSVDRLYDDGFVRVDATGNPGGYTWFWGFEDASQIQDGFISFHCQTVLDVSTIQLVTDAYELGALIPPDAPFIGSFEGPGPVLPDAPFLRTITVIPEPSCWALLAVTAVVTLILRTQNPQARRISRNTFAQGA